MTEPCPCHLEIEARQQATRALLPDALLKCVRQMDSDDRKAAMTATYAFHDSIGRNPYCQFIGGYETHCPNETDAEIRAWLLECAPCAQSTVEEMKL